MKAYNIRLPLHVLAKHNPSAVAKVPTGSSCNSHHSCESFISLSQHVPHLPNVSLALSLYYSHLVFKSRDSNNNVGEFVLYPYKIHQSIASSKFHNTTQKPNFLGNTPSSYCYNLVVSFGGVPSFVRRTRSVNLSIISIRSVLNSCNTGSMEGGEGGSHPGILSRVDLREFTMGTSCDALSDPCSLNCQREFLVIIF